ncbi:MAG: trehalose-phosphatase [Rhodothermales bacterium]
MPHRTIPTPDNPLFFLDYDGTLAPIVDTPSEAFPHPDAPDLLRDLDAHYPVWIVTGRFLQDLTRFISESYQAIGLHGMQEGRLDGDVRELLSSREKMALDDMRKRVPSVEGITVEEKGPTFAVHYRRAEDEEKVIAALEDWLEALPPVLSVIRGKKVYEIRPANLTKGTAVRRIAEAHPDYTPIYLGDDVTDEDAFAALLQLDRPSVTVKVGEGESTAEYRLSGPDEVMAYLRQFADRT